MVAFNAALCVTLSAVAATSSACCAAAAAATAGAAAVALAVAEDEEEDGSALPRLAALIALRLSKMLSFSAAKVTSVSTALRS
jgi:hypothetical protein